jgi:hypothetical protein
MKFKVFKRECFLKKRANGCVMIVPGVVVLAAHIVLSLRLLINPAPLFIAACWLAPEEVFVFNTLFLLLTLSIWSAIVWRRSRRISVHLTHRLRRATVFKHTALAIFPTLTLWFNLLLTIIIAVELPSTERWFVAMALSWMTTPFATLGFIYVGARLGSWLDRMR